MRNVPGELLPLCTFQGRVFEASPCILPECGSAVFIRRFMRSDVAARVDAEEAFEPGADSASLVEQITSVYGGKAYGSELYPSETLHWMGYMYRYWCLATGLSSRRVYAIAGAREMRGLYYAYHTLDPAQCVNRIHEIHGLDEDVLSISHGVEVLRSLRANA